MDIAAPSLVTEVFDQFAVGVVVWAYSKQQVEALADVDNGLGPACGVEVPGVETNEPVGIQ